MQDHHPNHRLPEHLEHQPDVYFNFRVCFADTGSGVFVYSIQNNPWAEADSALYIVG
jgi:hypothetical protein